MAEDSAIVVRDACKYYGTEKNKKIVLDSLNMTVPRGSIYGLLGASGCGKTTLLSCIVGRKHFNSGDVWVLGGKPGTKGSGVPGPRIGYMPQDVALVGEFTVKGAVNYFGWIFGMSDRQIAKRFTFLDNLLELPPEDRFIKNLSGGQKRRVSFAVALVHNPELLILDEPTVGLDPILRSSIWKHLVQLTADNKVTVIITTHYIEEAKQADMIGLLRGGKLLAESPPRQLMSAYNTSSLEEVFLALSIKQDGAGTEIHPTHADSLLDSTMDQEKRVQTQPHTTFKSKEKRRNKFQTSASGRMRALLIKNFNKITRHLGGMFFIFGFPILEVLVFFLAIGGDPKGLRVAVVDEELGNFTDCKEYSLFNPTEPILHRDETCDYRGLSCNYLNRINETKVYYNDKETAMESVKKGLTTGMLHFHSNFSKELQLRIDKGRSASNATIEDSELAVHLDMSNRQIALFLERNLFQAYLDLARDVMLACNQSVKLADIPMQFNDPVFGMNNENYAVFMTPGLIMSMIYFLATSLTSAILVAERNEGVWDRSIVAGVTATEILISHIISQMVCMLLQTAIVLILVFLAFHVPCEGSMATVIGLVALQGFCGMCFGFLVSALCDNLTTANYLALGSFYPYIFLCGMLWPLEGMPAFLRTFALCLPGTIPIVSMHDILRRGKGILESQVYIGFLITIAWIFIECGACVAILKFKSKRT
ncbi:ABC transporter G family member 20-like [Zootermopsis nevadensis]|uniref:ABC transporter G family member 20 n=1 Tax=Zootermopsis nevadensis TaxID=136037 RepID=A0A067R2A0_ZOONE|nr:ABC transporter G family member 20-like [Zootermopsis nevadensis]KDR16091.1 ABC transporter G family member 20 [Zootermopsis nevadensis]